MWRKRRSPLPRWREVAAGHFAPSAHKEGLRWVRQKVADAALIPDLQHFGGGEHFHAHPPAVGQAGDIVVPVDPAPVVVTPAVPPRWSARWSEEHGAFWFLHESGNKTWSLDDVALADTAFAIGCAVDLCEPALGKGGFGVVRRGVLSASGAVCAVKSLSATAYGAKQEANMLSLVQGHSNIVKLQASFQTVTGVHLVMERCSGGDLSDHLKSDALPDTLAASFNGQLLSGLEFVHSHDLVHCDVKPSNVLLTNSRDDGITLKLTDFGLAHFCPRAERLRGVMGTHGYMSPEVLEGSFGRACDLWACGLCFVPMFARSSIDEK